MDSDLESNNRSQMSEYTSNVVKMNSVFTTIILAIAGLVAMATCGALIALCFVEDNYTERRNYIDALLIIISIFAPSPLQFSLKSRPS